MRRVLTLLWPMVLASACVVHPNAVLSYLATNARTPKQHAEVAAAYREHARELRAEAADHEALARRWESQAAGPVYAHEPGGTRYYENEADHCRRFAANLAAAAADVDALAEAHDRLAQGSSR